MNMLFFIDSLESLEKISHLLERENDSSLLGIDFEWKPQTCSLEPISGASLMQIASKTFVLIFDVLKMKDDKSFKERFFKIFDKKTFLGHGMKSDINTISGDLKAFFLKKQYLDVQVIYKEKYSQFCPNLSQLCRDFLSRDLCKGEQMSNWERRPLRKRQLHYAALDAFILLKIYDKLVISKNSSAL